MTNLPLQHLLSPSDLILLAILAANLILGATRGLVRTIFGLFGKLAAIALAAVGARALAPFCAAHLVTPLIGNTLQRQVAASLQATSASDNSTAFLGKLSQTLMQLLDFNDVKSAAQPLQEAITQVTTSLAESIAYVLLFSVFVCLFAFAIRVAGEALHFLTAATPLKVVDRLGGAAFGFVCGTILCIVILWVLHQFAPALFTEVGALSPSRVSNTLLTNAILQLFS